MTVGGNGRNAHAHRQRRLGVPAIQAWRDHGLGVGIPDTSVTVFPVDVPPNADIPGDVGEGRYWVAYKVRNNNNGTWRYEYAIYNLTSDLAGGSFIVPVPADVNVTNAGFNALANYPGEVFNNNAWSMSRTTGSMAFACTTP